MTKGSQGGWWLHKNQLWKAIQLHTCKEHIFSGDVIRQENTRKKKSNLTGVYNTDCRGPAPCACRCGAEMCQREGGGSWGRVWHPCHCSVSLMETGFMRRVVS